MNLDAQLVLNLDQKLFANPRRMALLAAIAEMGSVSQGAKRAGMSYKAAWDAVKDMNQRAEQPLLLLAVGGKGGGGAELTPMGERLLKLYALLDEIQHRAVVALQDPSVPLESLLGAISEFSVQSSARNQYMGQVLSLESESGNTSVVVQLASGLQIRASITTASCSRLQLKPGREVIALIKAPAVLHSRQMLPAENASEANHFKARVVSVNDPELVLQLSSGDMLYSRLSDSKIAVDEQVSVMIDPDQVMLATITP